jgi:uncharacterized RDD family membrane protein YckC
VHRFGNVPLYLVARLLAFTIDIAFVGFIIATFAFNTFEPAGLTVYSGHDAAGFGTVAAVSFGGALTFAFLCESLFGTTLGKAIFALHVRRRDGGHAGVGRVFVRYLVRPIDLAVIGPVLALVTPRHQRLGDLAAGTVVARSRLGPLASLLGIAFVAALAYAQYAFGGGARSAFGVGAETATFGPGLIAKGAALFGVALAHPGPTLPFPVPTLVPKAAPSDEPSDVPETAASDAASDAETDAPRETPATDAPGEAPVTDGPRETPATDGPRETPATDASRETPAAEEPANNTRSDEPSDSPQQAPPTAASEAATGV